MTQRNYDGPEDLNRAIDAVKSDEPGGEEIRQAGARVWRQVQATDLAAELQPEVIHGCADVAKLLPAYSAGELPAQRALVVETHLRDCVACRNLAEGRGASNVVSWTRAQAPKPLRLLPGFGMAAAAAIVLVIGFFVYNAYFAIPAGARASIQSIDGVAYRVTPEGERIVAVGEQLNEGDVLRTGAGARARVKLFDGSTVEINQRSDFAVKARGKNATIALERGAVIVQAAKRKSGHLYVKTPDCRVAVTGTVFAVNAGAKGSRVSVIEGSVEVEYGGSDDMLHPGDQVSTGANMTAVPVAEDIAWSADLSKHLSLLAEFSKLQKRLDQVQLPGPRFNSALLSRMPADAVVYASLPNVGQALEEANRILQEQIQQSDTLKQWFTHSDPNAAAKLNDTVARIRQLSDYLGDEVVVVGFGGEKSGMALVSTVGRAGLQDFLKTQFLDASARDKMVVTDEAGLVSLGGNDKGLIALVRQDVVVFATDRNSLARVNAQLNAGSGGLGNTEFGARLADAYNRGAGFLLAADIGGMMAADQARKGTPPDPHFEESGLADMRYLVVEHREMNGVPDNHMTLDFAGERHGIASWLAAPAPMGSLQFVSHNASMAIAVVTKEPQLMFDDLLSMAGENNGKTQADLADAEHKLRLRIREDLAAHFGGDGVLALDGPVLPTPSWKFVIEIHDAPGLAASLQTLVGAINDEAQREGKPGVELKAEDVNGQRYYTVLGHESHASPLYYTFAAGYMIMGPNRAAVMDALHTQAAGDSLAQWGDFKALLPKDENANYSMIAYQNLGPVLQPLMGQLKGDQMKAVQQLAADSRPSVICAWGRQNRIEAATNSKLLGLDWLAFGSLISGEQAQANSRSRQHGNH
jgi:hypothetical protein